MTSTRTVAVAALLMLCVTPLSAQSPTDLAGSWTLNRQLSQLPQEIGFSASFIPVPDAASGRQGGGRRGGRESGPSPQILADTAEDSARVRFLTDEVRLPAEQLTIAVTPATVTITPDRGPARTVQPGRRDEALTLGPVTAVATATWDGGRLVIVYKAAPGRVLRYTYSASQNPRQLIVDVEFIEQGTGDKVRRVHEPTPAASAEPATSTTATPRGLTPAGASSLPSAPASAAVDQRPDAALKGLTNLGIVVEGLSPEAAKCGLKQDTLETTVMKRLTDAGFRVLRNSDEDTYLYVNINTVVASTGLCVSRYDVTLYSHAAAQLSHTASPVLLQVELLHRGGLAGGGPAAHADGVLKSVIENVDQFTSRIRAANPQ